MGRSTEIVVHGLTPGARYGVRLRSLRQHSPATERAMAADERGCLTLDGCPDLRGEHWVDVLASERVARLGFYVLPPDLYARRPLRCDFHVHTHYSDGDSPPARMVIRGRELGLDVVVITDHDRYSPSLEAMEAVQRLGLGLITGPGEEVSGPNWHVVAINAKTGVHELGHREHTMDGDRAWGYDALSWAVRTTQAQGGRAYLAHPYWAVDRGYHLPQGMYDRAVAEGILDGIELLGDVKHENNLRSLARYLDLRASGHEIPIVSNSDTHGAEHTYGSYWTLVYAERPTLEGVLEAIADGWSVACTTAGQSDEVGGGGAGSRATRMLALGTFELVDYAYFLEQQFFPQHDVLCREEAALAERIASGATARADEEQRALVECRDRMEALYARCWGRSGSS